MQDKQFISNKRNKEGFNNDYNLNSVREPQVKSQHMTYNLRMRDLAKQ